MMAANSYRVVGGAGGRSTPGSMTPGTRTPGTHTPGTCTPGTCTPGRRTPITLSNKKYYDIMA